MKAAPSHPLVSIVIAIHNGEATVAAAFASIQSQTFRDIEIIVIDDASDDNTPSIVREWQNQWTTGQCRVITHPVNQGLTKSLIAGVEEARGMYIARLDADDVWLPTKLEQQVAFLKAHSDYGIVGCWYINRTARGSTAVRLPCDDSKIRSSIFIQNPFGHSCVLVRRSILAAAGNYDPAIRFGQDYDLWFRLLPLTKLANIADFLVERSHDNGLSQRNSPAQLRQSMLTILKYARRYRVPWWRYLSVLRVGSIYGLALLKHRLVS